MPVAYSHKVESAVNSKKDDTWKERQSLVANYIIIGRRIVLKSIIPAIFLALASGPVYAAVLDLNGTWRCVGKGCMPTEGNRILQEDGAGNIKFINPDNPSGTGTTKLAGKKKKLFVKEWNTYVTVVSGQKLKFDDGGDWVR